ncbi:MAG TPA: hypothetical protein DCP63_15685 [Bacteroidetes bacterium]|nr:hypothetical protein [Bacteroidota bacterium]
MTMEGFVKVAEEKELSTRRATRVVVEGIDIALFLVDADVYAVQNDCPHQHFSKLHEGVLNGCEITCPMHGWTFDLRSGKATIGSGKLKLCTVKISNGSVWIEKPKAGTGWN